MQRLFSKIDLSNETVLISLLWAFFAFAVPTKVGNFDFRHFVDEEGLTLSVSRSAPPMAILEDERLTNVPVEPLQEIKRTKGSHIIVAGQSTVWPRLQYYSKVFERKLKRKSLQKIAKKSNGPSNKITDLINLVKYIPSEEFKLPQVYAVTFTNPETKSRRAIQNVREHVETPLVAPSVPRGLPKGEDAQPVKYVAPAMVAVTVRAALEPDSTSQPTNITTPLEVVPATVVPGFFQETVSAPTAKKSVVASQPRVPNSVTPPSSPIVKVADQSAPLTTPPVPSKTLVADYANPSSDPEKELGKVMGLDQGQTQTQSNPDLYRITGQVELSGGLVATGTSTKLDIQWQSGRQSRIGSIDYSSGQFLIEVPSLEAGKISARLVDETGTVLGIGEYDIENETQPGLLTLQGITLLVEAQEVEIRGQVVSAYNVGSVIVPIFGAEVFGPNSVQDVAEKNGNFNLSGLGPSSTFVMEAYAQEHWGTRILTSARRSVHIPVFANKMMDSFFSLVGVDQDGADYGIIWGEVKRHSKPTSGVQVKLAGAENIRPTYFNELRIPDKSLTATTSNGLFAFTKVRPGINVVNAQFKNEELPSTVVSVSASRISYSEISFKALGIRGSVFDPAAKEFVQADVSVVGASNTTASSASGRFDLRVPSSDPLIIVEAKAGSDYLTSRRVLARPEVKNVQINAYKKDWVKEKLRKVNVSFQDSDSILIGSIQGPGFHVQLDDPVDPQLMATKAEPQIFYFNEKGELDSTLFDSPDGGGSFVMVNVRAGLHTLVIQSANGETATSRLFIAGPGVANVLSLTLNR